MDDYHEYDYIANDAFIHQHLESLQIPSTSEIFENAFKSIQFDTIKKFDVVGQTATSSLFTQDNVLYTRAMAQNQDGTTSYIIGAMTLVDRTLAMPSLTLFDDAFMAPYEGHPTNTYVAAFFYDEVMFQNVQLINLQNASISAFGDMAFAGCQKLSPQVNIKSKGNELGTILFMRGCFSETNIVNFTANTTNIHTANIFYEGAFAGCNQLTSFDLTYTAPFLQLSEGVFLGCNQLTDVSFHRIY